MTLETLPFPDLLESVAELRAHSTLARSAQRGLALLLQAREYARQLGKDPWEFAVEIGELRRERMTVNDLRWLVFRGLIEHACDVTPLYEVSRHFQDNGKQSFSELSCFILTPAGEEFAAEALLELASEVSVSVSKPIVVATVLPVWDAGRHQLTFQGQVVKRFRQHSPNQEAVLTAFQEEGWPAGVYDPLSPLPNHDPKQRLRDTIKNLNRHQVRRLIQFAGDGSGERVLWEVIDAV